MTLHKRKVKGKSFLETLSMKWRYSIVLLYKSDPLRKLSKCESDEFSLGLESSSVRRFSLVPFRWLS